LATPQHVNAQSSQPVMHPGLYDPSASVVTVGKKSNTGLIIAILVVLLAGGGIAAFVVMNNKDTPGNGSGSVGSGSALVAEGSGSGSAKGPDVGSGSGSAAVAVGSNGSAASGSNGSDMTVPHDGSGSGSSAPSLGPPPVDVVIDANVAKFDVLEGGVPVLNGIVAVRPGDVHTITVKAKGYKDKTLTVDGKQGRVKVTLEPLKTNVIPPHQGSGSSQHNGSGATHTPPPGVDCSNTVVNMSAACRKQYCDHHPDDASHGCNLD
jgi:hypothetical protein